MTTLLPQGAGESFTPPPREEWMLRSNCSTADPEIFFKATASENPPGKEYCEKCEVVHECLIFALLTENPASTRYGIFGNATPGERDRLYQTLKEMNLV